MSVQPRERTSARPKREDRAKEEHKDVESVEENEEKSTQSEDKDESAVASMTVLELRRELKKRGLNGQGKKEALVKRLELAMAEESVKGPVEGAPGNEEENETVKAEEAEARTEASADSTEVHEDNSDATIDSPELTISESKPEAEEQMAESEEEASDEADTLEEMKVVELRAELKKRGLPTQGRKPELVGRLRAALVNPSQGDEPLDEPSGDAAAEESPVEIGGDTAEVEVEAVDEQDPLEERKESTKSGPVPEADEAAADGTSGVGEVEKQQKAGGGDGQNNSDERAEAEAATEEEEALGIKVEGMRVEELRRELKKRNMSAGGKKLDLIKRLRDALEAQGGPRGGRGR